MIEGRRSLVMWFGVFAPPVAWVFQLLAGWMVDEARCARASNDWGINDLLWQGLISAAAIVVAAVGVAAALATWRAVRAGAGDARGRHDFLAISALSAGLVFLLLTLVTMISVLSQAPCRG